MADFFDEFKNNINNRPEPEFAPEDWAEMNARLEARQRRSVPLWWWSTAALLLLLAGSNIWWFSQSNSTVDSTATSATVKTDTVFQKEIVYRIDTVIRTERIIETKYRTATAPQVAVDPSFFVGNGFYLNPDNAFAKQQSASFTNEYSAENLLVRAVTGLQKSNSPTDESQAKFILPGAAAAAEKRKNILDLLAVELTPLATERMHLSDAVKGLPLAEREKYRRRVLRQVWRGAQPTGFSLEASVGTSVLLNSVIQSEGTEGFGLTAAAEFGSAFRLWVSGISEPLRYRSNRQGEAYGVSVLNAPSDDFEFKYAKLSQSTLHFATGVQYSFRTRKKINPYVGLGAGGRSLGRGSIKYEFENEDNDDDEYEETIDIMKRAYRFEYLTFQTGVVYRWNDRWHTRLGAEYLHDTRDELIATLRLRLGVGYGF